MPRHFHIPNFYCYNCDIVIDVLRLAGCCKKCGQSYCQSFDFVAKWIQKLTSERGGRTI